MNLEKSGRMVCYFDTDSVLSFNVRPDVPPLSELCQLSERLGCLKVEKEGVIRFVAQASKTYYMQCQDGSVTLKAKGFSLFHKLMSDNNQEQMLEKSLFDALAGYNPDTSSYKGFDIYQKMIQVDRISLLPTLRPPHQSYKTLNVVGPRRWVALKDWVDFEYKHCEVLRKVRIDPIKTLFPFANPEKDFLFECNQHLEVPKASQQSGSCLFVKYYVKSNLNGF